MKNRKEEVAKLKSAVKAYRFQASLIENDSLLYTDSLSRDAFSD